MQTLDWQEHRATEIREILERTLSLLQTAGLVEWIDQGWLYQGDEQTLFYNPDSDQLSVFSNDRSWQLDWHEALFISDADTQITDAQLQEFRDLGQWLDSLEAIYPPTASDQTDNLTTTAARLFEQYAAAGEMAFKTSADSTEHFYRVEIDEALYWISREDVTGAYSLQREDGVPLTEADISTWAEVDRWLNSRDRSPSQLPEAFLEAPYWEQQTFWANQLLPQAESVFAFQEACGNLYYDPVEQSYLADIGEYQIGYSLSGDRFWIERDGERIVSASEYSQHRSDAEWNWGLLELRELGIEATDVSWFESWSSWLGLKAEQTENLPDWEAAFNRLWNDRPLSQQRESPPIEQPDHYEMDR